MLLVEAWSDVPYLNSNIYIMKSELQMTIHDNNEQLVVDRVLSSLLSFCCQPKKPALILFLRRIDISPLSDHRPPFLFIYLVTIGNSCLLTYLALAALRPLLLWSESESE